MYQKNTPDNAPLANQEVFQISSDFLSAPNFLGTYQTQAVSQPSAFPNTSIPDYGLASQLSGVQPTSLSLLIQSQVLVHQQNILSQSFLLEASNIQPNDENDFLNKEISELFSSIELTSSNVETESFNLGNFSVNDPFDVWLVEDYFRIRSQQDKKFNEKESVDLDQPSQANQAIETHQQSLPATVVTLAQDVDSFHAFTDQEELSESQYMDIIRAAIEKDNLDFNIKKEFSISRNLTSNNNKAENFIYLGQNKLVKARRNEIFNKAVNVRDGEAQEGVGKVRSTFKNEIAKIAKIIILESGYLEENLNTSLKAKIYRNLIDFVVERLKEITNKNAIKVPEVREVWDTTLKKNTTKLQEYESAFHDSQERFRGNSHIKKHFSLVNLAFSCGFEHKEVINIVLAYNNPILKYQSAQNIVSDHSRYMQESKGQPPAQKNELSKAFKNLLKNNKNFLERECRAYQLKVDKQNGKRKRKEEDPNQPSSQKSKTFSSLTRGRRK